MSGFHESGMDFKPLFENGNSLYIEKTRFFDRIGSGVRTVEFLSLMPGRRLYFVEAKSSAPNPDNGEDFDSYCEDLLEKAQHSVDLFASKELEINIDIEKEFPDCFRCKFSEYKLIFLLIIKNHKTEWCSDVLDGLQRKLIAMRKIWKIDILVLNEEKAQEKKFIL